MIIKASYEDLQYILALQRLAFQSEAELCGDFTIPPLTQTLESIRVDYKNQVVLKKVVDDKIIASVRAYEKNGICNIGRLIVHPEHQNKGLGKELMKAVEEHFSECSGYSLFTGKSSERNVCFYNNLGYQVVREEYVNDKLTILYFEKSKVV